MLKKSNTMNVSKTASTSEDFDEQYSVNAAEISFQFIYIQ